MVAPPLHQPLAGRRAVVTGGARGIGGAIARQLAEQGARVAVVDLLEEQGALLAGEIGGLFVPADLSDCDGAAGSLDLAIERLGGVDVLVNSAGIHRMGPLLDLGTEQWDLMLDINARGPLVAMQRCARAMIAQGGGGRIVNIASMAAKVGGGMEGPYAASKAALLALTRAAAIEWGPHQITVNAVCPGYVPTDMGAATRTQDDVDRWSALSPLGRLGRPEDVADAVSHLVSDHAGYITGQALNVTGGMIMH